ncbi:MAG: ABC transporter ATP-binding protein [Ignavibacteria bacterium]|nr:ABC transporter ATP-binding protein [Ignavibacteria bacterium]
MKVIKVENLSKAYRIGLKEKRSDTLGGSIVNFIKKPINNFKRLKSLSSISEKSIEDDVFWALKDINFEVKEGEILGIIGKNGAGKSTLLKILSRITEPTTGKIEINGRVASLLEVGTGFNPELTGRENTYLNGTILGMTKKEIDKKFDEIVEFSGVEKFIDTPVKRYSSGMRVRLAFAVAAFLEPEILIIDEVLAVGDAEFQKKCLGKMQDISSNQGRTVMFVSHNMMAVQSLCNKCMVLNNGKIKYIGITYEGIQSYQRSNSNNLINDQIWINTSSVNDHRAYIKQISVKPLNGEYITFESGLLLEFIIHSNIENQLLDLTFSLKNMENVLYFTHGNYVAEKNRLAKGIYILNIELQPFILNEGQYYLDVWLGLGATELIDKKLESVIVFEVQSSTIDHIIKPLPGLIRPKLNYKIFYEIY